MSRLSKDEQILRDNPDLQPYEYEALGMSVDGIARLQSAEKVKKPRGRAAKKAVDTDTVQEEQKIDPTYPIMDEVPQIVQKATPKVTTVIQEPVVAQPKVAPYQMPQVSNDIATVEFPNGKILKMSRVEAQKRLRKGKLKILS